MRITVRKLRQIIRETVDQMSLPFPVKGNDERDTRFLTKDKKKLYSQGPYAKDKRGPVWTKRFPSRSGRTELYINVFANGAFSAGTVGDWGPHNSGYPHAAVRGNVAPLIQKGYWDDYDLVHSQTYRTDTGGRGGKGKQINDRFHQSTWEKVLRILEDNVEEIRQAIYHGSPQMPSSDKPWMDAYFKEGKITLSDLQKIIKEEIEKIVTPNGEEIQSMFDMSELESGPKKVKQMKDYEDGVHIGVASLVDVLGVDPKKTG